MPQVPLWETWESNHPRDLGRFDASISTACLSRICEILAAQRAGISLLTSRSQGMILLESREWNVL
jgi:hypothetical protein